jgi:predicted benzoate:H+ symporter BenE
MGIASTLLAYVLGWRFLATRSPQILPALVTGIVLTGVPCQFATLLGAWSAPPLALTVSTFSPEAILTVVPVLDTPIALHANLTAVVYLRSREYRPSPRLIDNTTGLVLIVGPVPICMSLLLTPLTAGPEAGEVRVAG